MAEALGVELEYIAGENGSVGAFGPGFLAFDNPRRIDGTMYRGMIDSGGIEHFDVDTQEKLYHFYAHLKSDNKVDIRELQDVISAVEKFKKRNRRGDLAMVRKNVWRRTANVTRRLRTKTRRGGPRAAWPPRPAATPHLNRPDA